MGSGFLLSSLRHLRRRGYEGYEGYEGYDQQVGLRMTILSNYLSKSKFLLVIHSFPNAMIRFILLFTGCFLFSVRLGQAAEDRLNIILIMADDLGYETIAANGGESYKTPHIDRMAASGVRFTHCFAQPICTPTRVQIMTGKYNFRNYEKFARLKRDEKTFAHYLKDAGYATCIAGKWQLGDEKDSPQHFGFDEALLWQHTRPRVKTIGKQFYDSRFENPMLERNGVEEDYTNGEFGPDLITNFVCEFIEKKKDQPFLVYYPMMFTHCPWGAVPGTDDWDPKSPGSPTYKGKPQHFGDMVTYMDQLVGRIVNKVEELGLSDKTVILFTGDNGTDQPIVSKWNGQKVAGAKGKTIDAGTRVPLIVSHPALKKPAVYDDLIDFTDVLPTLCDFGGVSFKNKNLLLDGHSFAPRILGEKSDVREFTYCWYDPSGSRKNPKVFARTHRYKLYRSGEFYDLKIYAKEGSPMKDEQLDQEQKEIKAMLQGVIDKYDEQGASP